MYSILFLFVVCLLNGCNQSPDSDHFSWQLFCCRDQGNPNERISMYRALVPQGWERTEVEASIADTMKPICEFHFGTEPDVVHLSIHTFSWDKFDQRIPPQAIIQRWKRQFEEIDLLTLLVEPTSHGGFAGLYFQATGIVKKKQQSVMGFSMQLAPQHWLTLHNKEHIPFKNHQMAADFTIKAVGSPLAISMHKNEINFFANSFELIEEIPN